VLAAGWRSGSLVADLPAVPVPVRPVRGQTLRLDAGPGEAPAHVVRGIVQGRPVYVVPREPGRDGRREVVVGATSEEGPDDGRPTAGGAFALLRDARALLPALDEAVLVETTSRARPGSPDNLPLVGPTEVPGLVLAAGHHRNGILLAPITAAAVVAALVGAPAPDAMAPADPRRFTRRAATTRSRS
jgi:glycine oxidase